VNEAWLRLENDRAGAWPERTQGLALAAQAMRRMLVDHGRHQKRQKRGGRLPHVELDDLLHAAKTAAVPVEELRTGRLLAKAWIDRQRDEPNGVHEGAHTSIAQIVAVP